MPCTASELDTWPVACDLAQSAGWGKMAARVGSSAVLVRSPGVGWLVLLGAAQAILGQASSRTGAHAAALPALELAHARQPRDEALLADLLSSEAAVRGPAAALERFERYRADQRERLSTDPGEALQRVHRSLLALDRPVRRGVRYDATTLIGRDDDLQRLRALLAASRMVSIVGTGGLGKTRLANALARTAAELAVYVVELAGVTAAADVAGEVGSALGVRFAYNRTLPTMTWERIAAEAEEAAPGRIAELQAEYAARQAADLIPEARRLAELLPG